MSGRYFWDGTDMAEITGVSTGTDYVNASNNVIFKSIPGTKESSLNGYETYTDNETSFPPFFDNNVSIFRNIKVANTTVNSGTSTITKPTWANACKIYVLSKKGSNGSNGTDVVAANSENVVENNTNTNHNRNTHHNDGIAGPAGRNVNRRRNNWGTNTNIRHIQRYHYSAASGGIGGVGGNGVIYSTSQAFEIQSDDTINYTINNTHNLLTINQSDGTSRAIIDINHGTNGTNGTNATVSFNYRHGGFYQGFTETPSNYRTNEHRHWNVNEAVWDDIDSTFQNWLSATWNHSARKSNAGVDGANGPNGSVSNVVEFNNYTVNQSINTSITTPSIQVYWFKV